jgi:Ca2+-binding EF-hand superfamily protein
MDGTGMDPSRRAEMKERMFARVDANGDGSIGETEFASMAEKLSERSGQSIDAAEAFASLDTNADGLLVKDELRAGMKEMISHVKGRMRLGGQMPQFQSSSWESLQSSLMSSLLDTEV